MNYLNTVLKLPTRRAAMIVKYVVTKNCNAHLSREMSGNVMYNFTLDTLN